MRAEHFHGARGHAADKGHVVLDEQKRRLAAEDEISSGKLLAFPLGREGGTRNINLVYDRTRPVTPEAEKFIKTVKELFQL